MPINGAELAVILVLALVLIGPERLPHYAQQLGQLTQNLRRLTTDTSHRVREELGPELDDFDLRSLDPRQYDPRRIVREALDEDLGRSGATAAGRAAGSGATAAGPAWLAGRAAAGGGATAAAPPGEAPFDDEAT